MNLEDKDISLALKRLNGDMPAGWQAGVLRRMRRRRLVRRYLTAAAAVAAAIALPLVFVGERPDYIYTDRYYASLPPITTSILEQIDALLFANSEPTQCFYEPYDPLP